METYQSSTQRPISESCRHPSSKRKQELSPRDFDQLAAQNMRCINPDTPRPSIEIESYLEQEIVFDEDHPDSEQHSIPRFIDEGVLVGFWYPDPSGRGRRPVYCLVEKNFEFAYQKADSFILTRYDDFNPLDDFGDWLSDDTEDQDAMSPEEVKAWVQMIWESRVYADPDMTLEV